MNPRRANLNQRGAGVKPLIQFVWHRPEARRCQVLIRERTVEVQFRQGVQASFDWQAARDSTVGRMCTATLINDIEVY